MDGPEEKLGLYGRDGWQRFRNLPFFVVQESVSSRPQEEEEVDEDEAAEEDVEPEPKGLTDE